MMRQLLLLTCIWNLDVDIPIDMEDLEIYNYELVKRICSKMIMLKDTKSNVSKESNLSSSTFRRANTGMQAAAIAAELEVKLQYMYMEAEQCKLDRNRTEKELAIAQFPNDVTKTHMNIDQSYIRALVGQTIHRNGLWL